MLGRILASTSAAALILLWAMLFTTAPSSIGPAGILIVFVLMYVSALGVLTFLLRWGSIASFRLAGKKTQGVRKKALSQQEAYYYASVLALAPVMLIAMQSVNEVGIYQFLLVVLFVLIAWVYIAKRTN